MLADALVVATVAVTDLDRAKHFFQEQLGLPLLDETPFAFRFGAGSGTQMSVRRGQPNVGQTAAHFEVDDLDAVMQELTSRGVTSRSTRLPRRSTSSPRSVLLVARGSRTQTATCSACARDRCPARPVISQGSDRSRVSKRRRTSTARCESAGRRGRVPDGAGKLGALPLALPETSFVTRAFGRRRPRSLDRIGGGTEFVGRNVGDRPRLAGGVCRVPRSSR